MKFDNNKLRPRLTDILGHGGADSLRSAWASTDAAPDFAPLPAGRIRCAVRVALHRGDNGQTYNVVRRFDVTGRDEPERDPFAPTDAGDASVDSGANAKPEGGASCD